MEDKALVAEVCFCLLELSAAVALDAALSSLTFALDADVLAAVAKRVLILLPGRMSALK